jgi:hypothetical protein
MIRVGYAHIHLGQSQEALAMFQQALEKCHMHFPENHPLIGSFVLILWYATL